MTESLKKFAKELKSFREAKDISLQYIANRTKIDIKFLQAIEEGNFDILPDLYMRAFIKEYAKEADFDVTEVLKKYDLAKKGVTEEKISQSTDLKESNIEQPVEQKEQQAKTFVKNETVNKSNSGSLFRFRTNYLKFTYVSLAAVIILSIVVYFLFLRGESTKTLEVSDNQLSNNSTNRFELTSDSTQTFANIEDDSLKLALKASERVWVKVLSDNKAVFQNFINQNENLTFKAEKEFRVSVGNAGAISMELNKKPLIIPGTKGELRSYIINIDTVKSYLLSVPTRNESRP